MKTLNAGTSTLLSRAHGNRSGLEAFLAHIGRRDASQTVSTADRFESLERATWSKH